MRKTKTKTYQKDLAAWNTQRIEVTSLTAIASYFTPCKYGYETPNEKEFITKLPVNDKIVNAKVRITSLAKDHIPTTTDQTNLFAIFYLIHSQLVPGTPIPNTVTFTPIELLSLLGRNSYDTGGYTYRELIASLHRMRDTSIKVFYEVVRNNRATFKILTNFSLLNEVSLSTHTDSERLSRITIIFSDAVMKQLKNDLKAGIHFGAYKTLENENAKAIVPMLGLLACMNGSSPFTINFKELCQRLMLKVPEAKTRWKPLLNAAFDDLMTSKYIHSWNLVGEDVIITLTGRVIPVPESQISYIDNEIDNNTMPVKGGEPEYEQIKTTAEKQAEALAKAARKQKDDDEYFDDLYERLQVQRGIKQLELAEKQRELTEKQRMTYENTFRKYAKIYQIKSADAYANAHVGLDIVEWIIRHLSLEMPIIGKIMNMALQDRAVFEYVTLSCACNIFDDYNAERVRDMNRAINKLPAEKLPEYLKEISERYKPLLGDECYESWIGQDFMKGILRGKMNLPFKSMFGEAVPRINPNDYSD